MPKSPSLSPTALEDVSRVERLSKDVVVKNDPSSERKSSTTTTRDDPLLSRVFPADHRSSQRQLRDAIAEMRDLGLVGDLSDVVRLGAAVMVRRCCEEYRRRRVGTGWLIEAIRQGGAWCDPDRPPSPSQLLREIWGGPEPPWEWPQ